MKWLLNTLDILLVFSNVSTILASVGLILATSSFISGLQLVKAANKFERKIHRFNGFTTLVLYVCLAFISITGNVIGFWALLICLFGLSLFALKISLVRKRNRRSFKYVSWLGATLICMWLYVVYIHIPL